ncbi:hypothetical protein OV203_46715 [Nannocystis sp. ILAH1]|uniref:hypothetical protein n=1 Tax=Nannocystis sp. ILAH1 TaxID=2996789 RepID=UPI00226F1428|nr:hypothetical protein [Nannocystis sp. ILAH1]MCY0994708.1 hypothetical protein [Nannocystis sp. ILAH1]
MPHPVASLLTLFLAAVGPAPETAPAPGECVSDEYRLVDVVPLPGSGGEVETVASEQSLVVNFYLGGALVLTATERDGEAVGELTEYGLALAPERAAAFVADLEAALPSIMADERCSGPVRTKVDEKFKCGLLGVGVGVLASFFCPGVCAAAAGAATAHTCNYLVDKACEQDSTGC